MAKWRGHTQLDPHEMRKVDQQNEKRFSPEVYRVYNELMQTKLMEGGTCAKARALRWRLRKLGVKISEIDIRTPVDEPVNPITPEEVRARLDEAMKKLKS